MPKFEIELDDKGEFVGQLPGEVTAVLDRIKATSHGEGFGKGNQKAAEEAKAQITSTIASEKAKWEAQIATDRSKWADIEDLNKVLKTQVDSQTQESRKNLQAREEAHAAEITRRVDVENKLVSKIKTLHNEHLKALASRFGAREESLGELEVILQSRIDYTDPTNPIVLGEDRQPAKTTAGTPKALDVFVKEYLDAHPHHKKAAATPGGGVRSGAHAHGITVPASREAALSRLDGGDRSLAAIADAFDATRKRA